MRSHQITALLFFTVILPAAQAQTRAAGIFSDEMVVQRDRPIVIWDWDAPGTQVSATLGSVSGTSTTSDDSSWSITRPPMRAGGLHSRTGGLLSGFLIAAVDQVFRPAQVRIEGDSVIVWHPDIPEPVAVRYAWAEDPDWSLMNAVQLPASPFRTDAWHEATFGPP